MPPAPATIPSSQMPSPTSSTAARRSRRQAFTSSLAFPMLALSAASALAQPNGAELYARACARCHEPSDTEIRAPKRDVIRAMTPEAILRALETGSMKPLAQELSPSEQVAVAVYIADRGFDQRAAAVTAAPDVRCADGARDLVRQMGAPRWNGWGGNIATTRFQPAEAAGVAAGTAGPPRPR